MRWGVGRRGRVGWGERTARKSSKYRYDTETEAEAERDRYACIQKTRKTKTQDTRKGRREAHATKRRKGMQEEKDTHARSTHQRLRTTPGIRHHPGVRLFTAS